MATFKWYLNRQGPQGQRGQEGAKGDPGNTPIFSDGQNTPTVYTMIIDLGDGNTFETKNLKYPMRDDGGDYLRYDISEDTVYLGEPNKADLAGKEGEVRLATTTSVAEETVLDTDAVSYELFEDNNEKVTTALGNLDDKIEDVDDKVDAEADTRSRNDGILDDRINLAEGQITSLNNTKASKQELTDGLAGKANVVHTHTLSQITDAGALAGQNVVDYQSQVINKPIIPTPGNGTITITQGGVTKGTFTTNQSGDSTISLDAGGGASFTNGDGIDISNNVISAKVDNDTINFDSSGNLVANIPDVSNFVTNSSLATTLQSYTTNTQLANTLENYPTKTNQQNIINYEGTIGSTYADKIFSYNQFPSLENNGCPFYSWDSDNFIYSNTNGFFVVNNTDRWAEVFLQTYLPTLKSNNAVRLLAKQGDKIIAKDCVSANIWGYKNGQMLYFYAVSSNRPHKEDENFSATITAYDPLNYPEECDIEIEVLQDCELNIIFAEKPNNVTPAGTFSLSYENADGTPNVSFIVKDTATSNIKSIFNPDIAGNGLKINSVNKDKIEADVDGTTIGVNSTGQLTYIGTTGDVLPSQTGNSGKFLTTDGSVTSWAAIPQPDLTNYYTKTQTDSLLDGKISNDIVQSPLEYLPDTTNVINSQNTSTGLNISNDNGYSESGWSYFLRADDNTYKGLYTNPSVINSSRLGWIEYGFESLNLAQTATSNISNPSSNYWSNYCPMIFGYYENTTFIPVIFFTFGDSRPTKPYVRIIIDGSVSRTIEATNPGFNDYVMAINVTSSSLIFKTLGGDTLYDSTTTISLSASEEEEISKCTHVRIIPIAKSYSSGVVTNFDVSNYKLVNPSTSVASGFSISDFNSAASVLADVHPASLSLKYDSNTLGINGSNELTIPTATTSNLGLVKPDGSTITINNGVISAVSGTPSNMVTTKKTITQASANVSESSGTVTVTDADVTTSTMVSLYPSDTTTETWLANNLASNIITEGSGSFTFTINGALPSTFSMYYIIQEVS